MAVLFTHAVASFEPSASSVLLWTRLGEATSSVTWVVALDPHLDVVVARGTSAADAASDFTVVVEVGDLEAATSYWYRFSAGGVHSPVGRTRTLPLGPVDRFRLGTVCCAHFAEAPLGVYRALAEREVDLVLHLGDYIYEEAGPHGPRRHEPSHEAVTLDDYRRRLAQVRADPDAQALHLRHPMVAIWDDHDFCDNAWSGGAKRHDPSEHGPWSDRVASAARARQEWLPVRRRDNARPLETWRSAAIGDLAELILLDTRLVGRDRQAGDDGAKLLDDPHRSLLGDEQRSWLAEGLADTSRTWAIVASGVVVNELELHWPRPLRWMSGLAPSGYAILDGRVMHDDQWDGYPAERNWLIRRMRERADAGGRTVLLSGDVHSSWAFAGPIDALDRQAVAVEFTTPAVSSAAMGRARYPGLWRLLDREADRMNHVAWCDVTNRGYAIVEITPRHVSSHWWFVHPYDEDPATEAELAAGFTTARDEWPPHLEVDTRRGADPDRPGLPTGLPARPADLGRLRRRRRIRIGAKAFGTAVGAIAMLSVVVASIGHLARRCRRR
ncbi:MAG: alkaline phosphatase D family protein [Ilumatobacteraceae bacterium]